MTMRSKINILKSTYNQVSVADQPKKRSKIIELCGISEKTFYRWINNPASVPKLAKPIFAKVLGESEAKLFPVALRTLKSIKQ